MKVLIIYFFFHIITLAFVITYNSQICSF